MENKLQNNDYKAWLIDLKSKIKQSQIKASVAVNSQLILLYWELGRDIANKQDNAKWGSGFIDQLSQDLKAEFPEMSGFSADNLRYCKIFYLFYSSQNFGDNISPISIPFIEASSIDEQVVRQLENTENQLVTIHEQVVRELNLIFLKIPWGHHILILKKIKTQSHAQFYIQQTIENNWSRAVLEMQIESDLYGRQGKAINNFKNTLPEIESDLAIAILKDPYNFGFLTMGSKIKEVELEQKLVENITHFLLELGKGFAYMGRQFCINVGGKEYRTDLLFYHTKLKCYIIIELKVTEFQPEHIGKLNFYLSVINELVKDEADKPTIGILLCKSKNNIVVDFAFKDINKPLGISEFTYTELSNEIKQALPTIEQLTAQLTDDETEIN